MDKEYFTTKLDDHSQRLSKAEVRIETNEKDLSVFKSGFNKVAIAVVTAAIIGLVTWFIKGGAM